MGGALPDDLRGTAEVHGLPTDGWVFPPDSATISDAGIDPPTDLLALGGLLLDQARQAGITQLVPGDPGWPAGTGCDPLPCLWVIGDADVAGLLREAITVTGTPGGTAYGKQAATGLAYALATYGWTVTAGAATGTDAHAALAARAAGRPVLLVVANGLDQSYPAELTGLLADVAEHGAVVSAFPPGCPRSRARWAVQERLLGSITRATVVVEAMVTSRALLTAQAATQTGRIVCAVPGPITSAWSAGCHQLIADGTARLVALAADVIAAIDPPLVPDGSEQSLFQITGTASWDDGRWRTRHMPEFLVRAASHRDAADRGFEVIFATNPHAYATFDAGVVGPGGVYEAIQVTTG
ncbi:DNA-processing protein DprA [Micromonospora pisi]|uniref:DNA-processing protein DprA n=1 Tax=Micromonospora pisi TaxID=589240 RepID=UPI001B87FFED|nr:DNA-processing protein DprA [Micromonospora pisi]